MDELRQATKNEVEMRIEKEREELGPVLSPGPVRQRRTASDLVTAYT